MLKVYFLFIYFIHLIKHLVSVVPGKCLEGIFNHTNLLRLGLYFGKSNAREITKTCFDCRQPKPRLQLASFFNFRVASNYELYKINKVDIYSLVES